MGTVHLTAQVDNPVNTPIRYLKLTALLLLVSTIGAGTALAQNSIGVNPTSFSFCVAGTNSPAPPAQTLTIFSTTSDTEGYNANAFPNWIKLNGVATPPSISGDTTSTPNITVTIDTSAYRGGNGMQSGTIQVQAGNTLINVPVTLNVTPACGLTANPTSVSLLPAQSTQTVAVNGPSGALIIATPNYGVNNPTGWFNISTSSFTAGQSISVSLTTTNLPTGTSGSILFTQYGTNQTVTVPVTFTLTGPGNGTFSASPTSLNFSFTSLQSPGQSLPVSISGPITTVIPSVDFGTGPNGWLSVAQTSGVTPTTFSVIVNPANLIAGVTNGSVTFTEADNPNNFVTVPVSATVGTQVFSFAPNPLNFAVAGGSPIPQNRVLRIIGPNNSQVVVSTQVNSGGYQWLTVNGANSIAATLTNSTVELNVSVNPVNLPANQTFTGNVVVMQGSTVVLSIPITVTTFAFTHFHDFTAIGLSGALLYTPADGTTYTALSFGNGTYQYIYSLITSGFDTLRTGDFNGDGKADLIVYNSQTYSAYIGMSKGDGTFVFQSLFWSPGYNFVEIGDFNGDGRADVALYNSSTGTLYTGLADGFGGFAYKYTLISAGFTTFRVADFNGDGKADLFVYNSNTGVAYVGIGDGTGGFSFHPLFMSPGYDLIDVGDLNGDNKADIIAYNSATGNAATGISSGIGGFAFSPLLFSAGFTSVRLADHTGDGFADVTLYNRNTGQAYFGTGSGTGTFTFQSLFWSPGYDSVVPEDVNGDGKADVILYNSATGTEYTGISNGDGTFNYTYSLWGSGKILAR